jgi:hypothetical protein
LLHDCVVAGLVPTAAHALSATIVLLIMQNTLRVWLPVPQFAEQPDQGPVNQSAVQGLGVQVVPATANEPPGQVPPT